MFTLAIPAWEIGLLETPREEFDEAALIERCKNGDKDAFDPLYEKYSNILKSFIWPRLGRHAQDADDVVQETLIKAYKALPKFRGNATFSTWIHAIAKNECSSHLRAKGPQTAELNEELIAEESAPEDKEWQDELQEKRENRASNELQKYLSQLSEEHRDILVKRQLQKMTYKQIAKDLGIPYGTVKSRLNRARQAIEKVAREAKRQMSKNAEESQKTAEEDQVCREDS